MNGNNKYLEVGIFVAVGIAVLIMVSLMFAGNNKTAANTPYSLIFERDISGLIQGAPVRYLGVEVGHVVDMQLNSKNGTSVQVDLEVLESAPINSATYASLSFQGVTGVAFISLAEDNEIPASKLVAINGYKFPVIPTRDVGLSALLSSGPEITGRMLVVLDKLNLLLNEDNLDSLSNSLGNIETLTSSLAGQESTLSELPTQLKNILTQIDKTAKQIQGTINKGEPDFLTAMQNLNRATKSLEKVTVRLDKWAVEHEPDIKSFMSGGIAQTPELISDTREALRELEKLLAEFRKNPSQLIYKPQSKPVVVEP